MVENNFPPRGPKIVLGRRLLARRKGGDREAPSEGSAEAKPRPDGQEPNNEAVWVGRAGPNPRSPVSTTGSGCRFGRCAAKAVKLTPGDLHRVRRD